MTKNEIVGRLKDGGLDASSTNRRAAVYVADAMAGRAVPGWFAFRIVCDSEDTERRARAILSRWYDIDVNGNGVWRLKSKNRVPLMAIKRGGPTPPPPPTPTDGPMYFEAVEANSTVSLMSMLTTAPNLEYSTDGVTWQEWQHTTADNTHTFDTLTLTAVGDRVYLRGDNPNGFSQLSSDSPIPIFSCFSFTGMVSASGLITSIVDKDDYANVTSLANMGLLFVNSGGDGALKTPPRFGNVKTVADFGLCGLFKGQTSLEEPADLSRIETVGAFGFCTLYMPFYDGCSSLANPSDMPNLRIVGQQAFERMYNNCTNLARAANLGALESIGNGAMSETYRNTIFQMSDDGSTLNFEFPTPPITTTVGEQGEEPETFATAYDVADWMGNTNGFTTP